MLARRTMLSKSCVITAALQHRRSAAAFDGLRSRFAVRSLHCAANSRLSDTPLASTRTPASSQTASLVSPVELPREANIVIVGGGVIGCSIAYHLAKAGVKDIYLLEKSQLTHGCTWHAAGLLGQLRGTKNLTRMLQYSAACFGSLQADTGVDPEWRAVGSIRVASSMERWKELKRSFSQAKSFGFEMDLISPSRVKELCPVMRTDDLIGAAWIPSDGHVEPTSLTNAFAAGARMRGVKIIQGVQVVGKDDAPREGNLFARGRVSSLIVRVKGDPDPQRTHRIAVKTIINCAGLWARQLGDLLGTPIPTTNVCHQYLVSERLQGADELSKDCPSFRDPDGLLYYKPEQGGLVVGGWEPNTIPAPVPEHFGPELYEPDHARFEQHALAAMHRTPALERVGVRKLVNGPIPISPDGEPIMGLCPQYSNVFVAAGFTAGIGASGGAGKAMAEWVLQGEPGMDLWPLDIRRFGAVHQPKSFLDLRCVETYGNYYKLHYPGKEASSARDLRRSGAYDVTKQLGAVFGSKFGWERPLYFAVDAKGNPLRDHETQPSFNRRQDSKDHPEWDCVRAEHLAARNSCVMIDQSSFAKLEISGRDASGLLARLCNNHTSGPVGSVVYTQMLNSRGGIEADVTIARVDENRFYMITGSGFATRDFGWVRNHVSPKSDVQLNDVTTQWGVINVAGPNSRRLLEALGVAAEAISNEKFPFMTWRWMDLGCGVSVRVLRVTFIGELGFELHVPMEQVHLVFSSLWRTAQAHPELGVRNAGYRCLETLRLEKGYRVWGSDLGPQTNPLEVGLGFCCAWGHASKGRDGFIGEKALQEIRSKGGPSRKLACFTIEGPSALSNASLGFTSPHSDAALGIRSHDALMLLGNEAISCRGRGIVGYTTSAGFGYTVGKDIHYAIIPRELADSKDALEFTVNAYETEVKLTKQPNNKALYDHKREKILA